MSSLKVVLAFYADFTGHVFSSHPPKSSTLARKHTLDHYALFFPLHRLPMPFHGQETARLPALTTSTLSQVSRSNESPPPDAPFHSFSYRDANLIYLKTRRNHPAPQSRQPSMRKYFFQDPLMMMLNAPYIKGQRKDRRLLRREPWKS